MKILGMIFIAVGMGLLLFVIYSFLSERNKMVSPLPEEKGVKVIFVTPGK